MKKFLIRDFSFQNIINSFHKIVSGTAAPQIIRNLYSDSGRLYYIGSLYKTLHALLILPDVHMGIGRNLLCFFQNTFLAGVLSIYFTNRTLASCFFSSPVFPRIYPRQADTQDIFSPFSDGRRA